MWILCSVFGVSDSGYYAWAKRSPSKRAVENPHLEVAIAVARKRTRETYGPEHLQKELTSNGFHAGVGRIKRLRKKLGIRCKQRRKFKATTNEGWLYLAGVKDIYTCELVGYAMDKMMTTDLVASAIRQAVRNKRPEPGLIHHSDRGSQYCAHDYRKLLKQFGMVSSMSRKGNCYDNAPMESFWGTLKTELVHHRRYQTRAIAIREITEFIEIFYNRQRRHSRLGNIASAAFARQFSGRVQEMAAA